MGKDNEKIAVTISKYLEDLIPEYLRNRQIDIAKIENSLEDGDFENIRITGHSMKGSGGGYGFEKISIIGATFEAVAKEHNAGGVKKQLEELKKYLKNLKITYELGEE